MVGPPTRVTRYPVANDGGGVHVIWAEGTAPLQVWTAVTSVGGCMAVDARYEPGPVVVAVNAADDAGSMAVRASRAQSAAGRAARCRSAGPGRAGRERAAG